MTPVVALLDSNRAGEAQDGVPIVGSVDEALALRAEHGARRRRHAGGRFPAEWRSCSKSCISNGLDVENGLHVRLRDDPELTELAAEHGVELRDLRRPPEDLSTADR